MNTQTDRNGQAEGTSRRACSVSEAASYLGISSTSVRALIAADKLAARRFGSKVLIEFTELDAFFDALPEVG